MITLTADVNQTLKSGVTYRITTPLGVEEVVAGIDTMVNAANIVVGKAIQSRGTVLSLRIIAQIDDSTLAQTGVISP